MQLVSILSVHSSKCSHSRDNVVVFGCNHASSTDMAPPGAPSEPSVGSIETFAPATSRNVGPRSYSACGKLDVAPAAITPGHMTMVGERKPPSHMSRFLPIRAPLLTNQAVVYERSSLHSVCGPLSLANTRSVLRSLAVELSASNK